MALRIPVVASLSRSRRRSRVAHRRAGADARRRRRRQARPRRWPTPAMAATPFLTTRTSTRRTRCRSCTASAPNTWSRRSRPTRAANVRTARCMRRPASMNEQDMADIAAYLAGPEVLTQSKNDVPATDAPQGDRNLPRVPRHQRRRHHRRLSRRSPASTATTSSARCTTTRRADARTPSWRAWRPTLTRGRHRAARGLLLDADARARSRCRRRTSSSRRSRRRAATSRRAASRGT